MTEIRGLVKLFGKTFPVPAEGNIPAFSGDEGGGAGKVKDTLSEKSRTESKEKDQTSKKSDDEEGEPPASPTAKENHKPSNENQEEAMPAKASKLQEEEENDARSNSEEKTMKKPDKILPCPRCESLDTKFCYYNNYNVNQPRHFCKNCQRYWTAGGTMRNVPVGAGRRKNKSSSSHYRHLTVSEASLQTVQCDISQVIHHHPLKPNGTVLSFGSDMPPPPLPPPLCESIFAEKTMRNHSRSGFHHRMEEHMVPFSCGGGEKGELEKSHSSVSSLTATDSISTREGCGSNMPEPESHQGYPPLQIPSFNGSPWPHPWNAAPAFCASGFPISFYPAPAAYWGCAVPGGAWAVPWLSPVTSSSSSSYSSSPNTGSSSPNSPLGKHSRDGCVPKPLPSSNSEKAGDAPEQTNQEGRIWVPKTLRIDDPDEAARSSIWATMGMKNNIADGGVSDGGGGGLMFKAFHPKSEDFKNHVSANSHVLHANPAAMSRSLNFQESL